MKKISTLIAFFVLLVMAVPYSTGAEPQDDAPVFTDRDLPRYGTDEKGKDAAGPTNPVTVPSPAYSTYEHYLKGNLLDPNWLTIADVTYSPKVISGPSRKITPRYEVFGTWTFTARTPADTPAGKTFRVAYSILFYGAGNTITYAGTDEFYLGPGNFDEQSRGDAGIVGTYHRTVTHYEDFRTDECNSSLWKIVVDSIEVLEGPPEE